MAFSIDFACEAGREIGLGLPSILFTNLPAWFGAGTTWTFGPCLGIRDNSLTRRSAISGTTFVARRLDEFASGGWSGMSGTVDPKNKLLAFVFPSKGQAAHKCDLAGEPIDK